MSENDKADTIVVFTARSPERIVREGGSQAWVLNPVRARLCSWLLCAQNRHNPDHEFSDATEPHGTGFLLGKIAAVRKSPEDEDGSRWLIAISEFTRITVPGAWKHWRNPVRYTTLEELGITINQLKFMSMPKIAKVSASSEQAIATASTLTIAEAKKALAATFGVKPEAVEITIRG